jgi:hypothetical protein
VSRPPESWSRLAVALASSAVGYTGASRISVNSPMRVVAPAAAASVVSES